LSYDNLDSLLSDLLQYLILSFCKQRRDIGIFRRVVFLERMML